MIGAGRMTATARADTGCFRSPTISVGPGFSYRCVMTLVSFDDDELDWEFAFDSRLGHPTGTRRSQWQRGQKKRSEELPILHPDAAGIDIGASELLVAVRVIPNLSAVPQLSLAI